MTLRSALRRAGCAVLVLLAASGVALHESEAAAQDPEAAEQEPEAADEAGALARASQFIKAFFDGRDADARRIMTEEMRAAMTDDVSQQLRGQLAAQLGPFQRAVDPRLETVATGHRVIRMSAIFQKGTVDFRVSVDSTGRIAGFFIIPHEAPAAPPAEAAPPPPKEPSAAPAEQAQAGPPPPEPPPVREIEVLVGGGDDALPGTLALPDGAGPFPAAVLIHGSGPSDRDQTIGPNKTFRDLAHGLARRGVAALRYDKRSYARPGSLLAAGPKLTVEQEVIVDAVAAIRLLRARADVDARRVFVAGHSLGASIAPRIATAVTPRPAGLVLLAAAARPPHVLVPQQVAHIVASDGTVTREEQEYLDGIRKAMAEVDSAIRGKGPAPAGNVMGAPFGYWKDLAVHDPVAGAKRAAVPLLVLQGGRDYQVTAEDFAAWQRGFGAAGTKACLQLYPELDHLFRSGEGVSSPDDYMQPAPLAPEVVADVAAWIREGRCPGRE